MRYSYFRIGIVIALPTPVSRSELGVRLNFDFSPVTRYIRRLRYQARTGDGVFDFPADEAEEVMKLVSRRRGTRSWL